MQCEIGGFGSIQFIGWYTHKLILCNWNSVNDYSLLYRNQCYRSSNSNGFFSIKFYNGIECVFFHHFLLVKSVFFSIYFSTVSLCAFFSISNVLIHFSIFFSLILNAKGFGLIEPWYHVCVKLNGNVHIAYNQLPLFEFTISEPYKSKSNKSLSTPPFQIVF